MNKFSGYSRYSKIFDRHIMPNSDGQNRYSNLRGLVNPALSCLDDAIQFIKYASENYDINFADMSEPYKCFSTHFKHDFEDTLGMKCYGDGYPITYVLDQYNFINGKPTRWEVQESGEYFSVDNISRIFYAYADHGDYQGFMITSEDDEINMYSYPGLEYLTNIDSGYYLITDKFTPSSMGEVPGSFFASEEKTIFIEHTDSGYTYELTESVYSEFKLYYYPFNNFSYRIEVDEIDYEINDNILWLIEPRPSFNPKITDFDENNVPCGVHLENEDIPFQPHEMWIGDVQYEYITNKNYIGYLTGKDSYFGFTYTIDPDYPKLFYSHIIGEKEVLPTNIKEVTYGVFAAKDCVPEQEILVSGIAKNLYETWYTNPSLDNPYTFTIDDEQFSEINVEDISLLLPDIYNKYHPTPYEWGVEITDNSITISGGSVDSSVPLLVYANYTAVDYIETETYVNKIDPTYDEYEIINIWRNSYVKLIPLVNAIFTGTVGEKQIAGYDFNISAYIYRQIVNTFYDHSNGSLKYINIEDGRNYDYNQFDDVYTPLYEILSSGINSIETITVPEPYNQTPYQEVWNSDGTQITGYSFKLYDTTRWNSDIKSLVETRDYWYALAGHEIYVLDRNFDADSHILVDKILLSEEYDYNCMTMYNNGDLIILFNNSGLLTVSPFYDYAYSNPSKNMIYFREYYDTVIVSGI